MMKLFEILPNRPLTNIDLIEFAKKIKIPNFRGVYMRDAMPKKIKTYEKGIINLDNSTGAGSHWTAYKKFKNKIIYFDSFGNLQPPLEVMQYFKSKEPVKILYNYNRFQKFNTFFCGHLCLLFLYK